MLTICRVRIQLRLLRHPDRLWHRRHRLLPAKVEAKSRNGILPERSHSVPGIRLHSYLAHDIVLHGLRRGSDLVSYMKFNQHTSTIFC